MKLVQISDLHFVPPGTRLLGLDPRVRLEAPIADINEHHGDAALCLITGDLADHGAPEAYAALREALAALQIPTRPWATTTTETTSTAPPPRRRATRTASCRP